jgi:F0F1-type ATP synthase assembly protein I
MKMTGQYKEAGPYLGLGTQLAASIVIMLFIGKWLDGVFGLFPVLTIIFAFLGGGAVIYSVIKTALEMSKKKNEKNNR